MKKERSKRLGVMALPLMLAAFSSTSSGRTFAGNTAPFAKVCDLSAPSKYCGFAGEVPATASGFYRNTRASVRIFYNSGAGIIAESRPIASLGVLRMLPGGNDLIYFGPRGVEILKPAPPLNRRLRRSWLVRLARGQIVIAGEHFCRLSADGRWAAFAVWSTTANRYSVNLVRISTGRRFSVRTHGMVTGAAFAGANLLASTGVESPQLWTFSLPTASNARHFSVTRRVAAPGKLVGVLGTVPVFEGRMQNVMFVGNKRVAFRNVTDFGATCGTAEVLITAANGRILLWDANRTQYVVRLPGANAPYYDGCGTYRGGFWLSLHNGRVLLVSDQGKTQQFTPQFPVAAKR